MSTAYIATIRTEAGTSTELLIAASESAAQADADRRHGADGYTVLVTVEEAALGPVVIVGRNHEAIALARMDVEHARRYATRQDYPAIRRVLVPFAVFGSNEPVLREVDLLASYADGYSRVRLAGSRTAKVHTSTIRPLGAAVSAMRHAMAA